MNTYLNREIYFARNSADIAKTMLLKHLHPNQKQVELANTLPAVHGTTVDRLLSISNDGSIYSHRRLREVHPEIVADGLNNATDELDIELGLDNYVFLGIGRINPADIMPAYLLFNNTLIDTADSIINLREIVHHGALVSPEATDIFIKDHPNSDTTKRNKLAADKFFSESLDCTNFRKIFPIFLTRWTPTASEYALQGPFPNTPSIDGVRIGWEGPQLMIPNLVSVKDSFGILLTDESDAVLKRVAMSGFDQKRIFRMNELLSHYKKEGLKTQIYQGNEGKNRYPFINMAIQDLALRELVRQSNSLEAAIRDTQQKIKKLTANSSQTHRRS